MAYFKSGHECSVKEHEKALEKLNKIESEKIFIKLLHCQTTTDEVLDLLRDYDEVRVVLSDREVLRVCNNNIYFIGDNVYKAKTSQQFKLYINFILESLA